MRGEREQGQARTEGSIHVFTTCRLVRTNGEGWVESAWDHSSVTLVLIAVVELTFHSRQLVRMRDATRIRNATSRPFSDMRTTAYLRWSVARCLDCCSLSLATYHRKYMNQLLVRRGQ